MKEGKCKCSYCEEELVQDCMEPPFCQPCEIVLTPCKKCGESFSDRLDACPVCGAKRTAS